MMACQDLQRAGLCSRALAMTAAALVAAAAGSGLQGQMLYWTAVKEYPDFVIRRSGLDGSNLEDIVTGIEGDLAGLAVDDRAGRLYWVERGASANRIVRADLGGGDRKVLLATQDFLSRIAVDGTGDRIYFSASTLPAGAGIRSMGLEGGNAEEVIQAEVVDLAVDGAGGRIYWVQEGGPNTHGADIWRAGLDGGNPERIVHHRFDHYTTGIALDPAAAKLYWATVDYTDTHAQFVQRSNLDGTGIEPVATANPGLDDWPVFIDLDLRHRRLYWVNGEDGVFFRAGLDGGEAERLFEDPGAFGPFDMVVVHSLDAPPPPPEYRRGDADGNRSVEITDAILILGFLFLGERPPPCLDAGDIDDNGAIEITDPIALLEFLFLGEPAPTDPGPDDCGPDATADGLDCAAYDLCP